MSKPLILILPAWYPCSFFKEQADLVSDEFEIKILLGEMNRVGKKKALINQLKGRKTFSIEPYSDYSKISYQYINHLPKFLENRQLQKLTQRIGAFIVELFDGKKPDCIHIQSISDTAVFVCKWAKENGIRVVLTEHILFVRHEINPFSKLREQVYETVDEVLCVSNYVYRNLLTSGFKMKKVSIIGNLVDDRFIPADLRAVKKNGKILFVANHYHDKGLDTLLSVAEKIQKENHTISIDVVGLDRNSLFNDTTSMGDEIDRRGLSLSFNLLGFVPHEKLFKMYSEYSILLSTSISETFGLVVAEAIAYGTKVVCTDSGGIRDFVNENNGVVVPINDAEALYKALIKILDNDKFDIKDSENIRKKYGYTCLKNKLIKIYNG